MSLGNYYAKILLFGEYGIILDSMALTVPFTHFHGELSFGAGYSKFKYTDYDFALTSNALILDYVTHLEKLTKSGIPDLDLNIGKLKDDLEKGLYFESTIPQGYGLGSSGALVAAIYDGYSARKIPAGKKMKSEDILRLKAVFSAMEGFFHGKSSGIDPLNAYIKYPLFFRSAKQVETVEIPQKKFGSDTAIFLVNSNEPGKTEPMVNLFLKNTEKKTFNEMIRDRFIPLNNRCIECLIQADMNGFFSDLEELSLFQRKHFEEMIPPSVVPVWENGLHGGDYYLKLCGSGGGGYFLGFTQNYSVTKKYLTGESIEFITVYKGN
ncbi:MAG: hypothetical protein JXA03_10675 [Bacteroidales bacterium]|nr:hypothetical protein [Bacteroidales bacterium]